MHPTLCETFTAPRSHSFNFSSLITLSFTRLTLSPSTMTAKAVLFTAPPGAAGSAPDGGADPGEMRTWLGELDKLELESPYVVIGKALWENY